jgi:hypothetical protein
MGNLALDSVESLFAAGGDRVGEAVGMAPERFEKVKFHGQAGR